MRSTSKELSEAYATIHHHVLGDGGLLDQLRPYQGRVDPAALAEITASLLVVRKAAAAGHHVAAALSIAFQLIIAVRGWALAPDSMLMRNTLLTDADAKALQNWMLEMEDAFASILGVLADREKDV